jgi:parallel beta-helix repeat protein
MKRVLVLIVFVMAPMFAHGATFYVSKNGTNTNTCTQAQSLTTPKLTIAQGLACLAAADTLIIKAGTYTEGINYDAIPSGKSDSQRTTIQAAGGETVVINGTNSFGMVVTIYDRSFVTLDGLTIDAALQRPVGLLIGTDGGGGGAGSHYITVKNGVVKNARNGTSACITSNGSAGTNTHLLFKNLEVFNCQIAQPQGMHGIYLTARDSIVEDCIVHDNDGHGIHQYNGSGGSYQISNNIIRRNKVYNNGAWGILVGGGSNNVAYDNIVYKNGYLGNAGGIRIGYAYGGTNNRLLNNTIYGNTGMCAWIHDSTSSVVQNTICFANDINNVVDSGDGSSLSNNMFNDPKFVDAAKFNFALQATSAAIDAGKAVAEVTTDFLSNARPQGSGIDVGALEYGSATQQPGAAAPKNLRQSPGGSN